MFRPEKRIWLQPFRPSPFCLQLDLVTRRSRRRFRFRAPRRSGWYAVVNGARYAIYRADDRDMLEVAGVVLDLDDVARCEWEALDGDRATFMVVERTGREHRVTYALPVDTLERTDLGFEPLRNDLLSAIWRYWKTDHPRGTQWLAP